MAIKKERTGPTTVKIYDDEFDAEKMHLRVSKSAVGDWLVNVVYPSASSLVDSYDTAQQAVDAAERHLKDAMDELDDAIS